ncbi:MAG: hypothetical protein M3321_00150 [Actinomycetota bacterium]|nr:hypothetical protein [Actinomycetota bacterium]
MALADIVSFKSLRILHPDARNPRLPEKLRGSLRGDRLLKHLADNFDAITVAESIARHGYFGSEPLVVTRTSTRSGNRWTVLEGNRRLTALLGLARPDLRATFRDSEDWERVAADLPRQRTITLRTKIPVLVAGSRQDADALIGFRHIAGVQEWKPLQRAQFIAHLVDERAQSFLEVAETVGEEEPVVRMLYRNQSILSQAARFGEEDVAGRAEARFGTYTAALNRNGLRDFIGARPVDEVRERVAQLTEEHLPDLVELASWLYGDNRKKKVISDTRELTMLAEVVRVPRALRELRKTRDLQGAYALTPGPPKRLIRQLSMAVGHLKAVVNSVEIIADQERAHELVAELQELTEQLIEGIDE